MTTDPLFITFDVACAADHAFAVWTARIGTWWPADHTVSGYGEVILEGRVGGRIYERTVDGAEHDWGEVLRWDPPAQLVYLWHIGSERRDATEVEVRFIAHDNASTRIEIEHRGWDRLGPEAAARRERNVAGWATVLDHFRIAAQDNQRGEG